MWHAFSSERNGADGIFLFMDINGENQKQINFEPTPRFVGIDEGAYLVSRWQGGCLRGLRGGTCKIIVIESR